MFELMQRHLPTYKIEAPKLLKLLVFNYLFSNGDAHFKNFSVIETPMGDYRLSPAYDLLNSRFTQTIKILRWAMAYCLKFSPR